MELLVGNADPSLLTGLRNAIATRISLVDHGVQLESAEALGACLQRVLNATERNWSLRHVAFGGGDTGEPGFEAAHTAELSRHLNQILKCRNPVAATMALGLFRQAEADGKLAALLTLVKDKRMPELVRQLNDSQKQELLQLVSGSHRQTSLEQALNSDQAELRDQIRALDQQLNDLSAHLARDVDPRGKSGAELAEVYKPAMRSKRAIAELKLAIQLNLRLPQAERERLLNACELSESVLDSRVQLSPAQRTALFSELMNPALFHYAGRASHALMDDLIATDARESSQLKSYLPALLKDALNEGVQIVRVLQLIHKADPAQLPAALALIPADKLLEMTLGNETRNQIARGIGAAHPQIVARVTELIKAQVTDPLQESLSQFAGTQTAGLSELIRQELSEHLGESAVTKASESLNESLQEAVSAPVEQALEAAVGRALDQALVCFGARPEIVREQLLQLLTAGGADQPAEALRRQHPGYQEIHRDMEALQTLAAAPGSGPEAFKAILRLERGLKQTEARIQHFQTLAGDPRKLSASDLEVLEQSLQPLRSQIRDRLHELDQLPEAQQRNLLEQLVREPGFLNRFSQDQDARLLIDHLVESARDRGTLRHSMDILFRDPQAHAGSLLEILTDLDAGTRQDVLRALKTDALQKLDSGLGPEQKQQLLGLIETAAPEHLEAARRLNPAYVQARAAFDSLPADPVPFALAGPSVSDQVAALKIRSGSLRGLRERLVQFQGLEPAYQQPFRGQLETRISALEAQLSLSALSSEQKMALAVALRDGSGGRRTRDLLDRLIDATQPADIHKLAQTLSSGSAERLQAQIFKAFGVLVQSNPGALRTLLGELAAHRPRESTRLTLLARACDPLALQSLRQWAQGNTRALKKIDKVAREKGMRF